ncbi:MAG: hypothetical protein K6G58_11025 [Lachnospiraceae bacterium]|nr:hypothetical protein [Lachnospiraceae bacterium]
MPELLKRNIKTVMLILGLAAATVLIIAAAYAEGHEEVPAKEPRIITLTIDVPDDIPLEEKELLVFESLTEAGYSPAGACGMMGNIAVESPDFDPTVVNETNGAYGLFQWTDVGDRQQHLKDFCREHGMNWGSAEGQIAFAVYELSGADPIACRLDDLLKETDDPYTAAAEFTAGFERCIADSGKAADRYMGSLYPEFYGENYQSLAKRINKAMNYYNRFSDDDGDSEINITIDEEQ